MERPSFFGQLTLLKPGKTGYLFMITKQGTIIHHPDSRRILANVKGEKGGPVPSTLAAMNGFEGWVVASSKKGVKALITYKQLRKTDWIIGAVYPIDEAFAPLIDMRKNAMLASGGVAIAAGLIGWLAIVRLLLPLGALRRHVSHISDGSHEIEVFDVVRRDEFGDLSRAFFTLSQQRRDAENSLIALTRTDPLTGLNNRRMFEETMSAALARARRNKQRLTLAYLDIDRFKQINDTYGHGTGDQVLIEFSQRLKRAMRVTDTVARLAGDEFVVIFENLADDTEISNLANKILASIEPAFMLDEVSIAITTSMGLATNANGSASFSDLVEASDKALYDAKHGGRNRYAMRFV